MGAKNHAVVLPDADVEAVASALAGAAFGAAGQRCMAISAAVFVGGFDRFRDALLEKARSLKVGGDLWVGLWRGRGGQGRALLGKGTPPQGGWPMGWKGDDGGRAAQRVAVRVRGRPAASRTKLPRLLPSTAGLGRFTRYTAAGTTLCAAGECRVGGGRGPGPCHLARGQAAHRTAHRQWHPAGG